MGIGRQFRADRKCGLGAGSGVAIPDKRFDNFGYRSGAERECILPAAENVARQWGRGQNPKFALAMESFTVQSNGLHCCSQC